MHHILTHLNLNLAVTRIQRILAVFSFVSACIGPIKHVYKFELNMSMRYGNIYMFPKGNVAPIVYQNDHGFYEGKMQ